MTTRTLVLTAALAALPFAGAPARSAHAADAGAATILKTPGFSDFLKARGYSVKEDKVTAKGGEAVDSAKLKSLFAEFQSFLAERKKLEPKKDDKKGIRFGLEVGTGPHPRGEPYGYKGIDDALDWDVSFRARMDGLGGRLGYRHELPVVPVTVSASFIKYADIAGAMGLPSSSSDDFYRTFLDTPGRPIGGFGVGLSAHVSPTLGFTGSYDQKETLNGDNWSNHRQAGGGVSLSPLGENKGKDWNVSFVFAPDYRRRERKYVSPPLVDDQEGAGYNASVIGQYGLDKLPIKWLRPGKEGNGWVWMDRAKATFSADGSMISSLALRWTLETSLYISKYFQLTPGAALTWRPKPQAGNPDEAPLTVGPLLGLDVKNFDLKL